MVAIGKGAAGGGAGAGAGQGGDDGGGANGGRAGFSGVVAFNPIGQVFPDGTFATVQAVVSADRRYVRMNIVPVIQTLESDSPRTIVVGGTAGGGNIGGGGGGVGGAGS